LIDYLADGPIARITLNRPEKRNALSPAMIAAWQDALAAAAEDRNVRVVLLRGTGRDFCAGLDLTGMHASAAHDVLDHLAAARLLADVFRAFRRHPHPILGAVHGRALAGGCGLATACDLVLASESAQFHYTEVNIGFVAAIVASMLRRSVGEKLAFELLAGGEPISASRAREIGMINHVYPDDGFHTSVEAYAARLAEKSPSAITLTKSLLYHVDGMPFESAIQSGVFMNALARMTEDARHGIERFVNKKK
jgi:methylglutaconyl-CoA hydratase